MNEKIRVLLVTKSTGGVAEYIRWLVHGLDRAQFSLTVACLSENGAEFAAELAQIEGIEAFILPMNRYKINPVSDFRLILKIRSILKENTFDLVHAHASKPGFATRIAAIGMKLPVFYSPHGFAFHAGAGRLTVTLVAWLERFAAAFTTRIITVADGERELAQKYQVGNEGLFLTVHSGIDLATYRHSVDVKAQKELLGVPLSAPLVGTVGRLSKQKSPEDFLRTAAAIHVLRPDVNFVWIGDGPLREEMHALANSLGLNEVFHWAGQRQGIPQLLRVLDCFLLTSRWEGFPLVVLESLAAETPVVATDILGTRESIASGVNGWLAPVGDADALAKAVLDILENPERAASFRAAGLARIEKEFTREKMLFSLEQAYLSVLDERTLAEITETVQECSTTWFGEKTKLAESLPEMRKYPFSFILRYLSSNSSNAEAVLIKIPRKPHLRTLRDAVSEEKLRAPTMETYRQMLAIWEVFQTENSPDCTAIEPLRYLSQWNGIVMREVKGTLLKNLILRWKKDWSQIENALSRSAKWLRIFHQRVGQAEMMPFSQEDAQVEIEEVLAALMHNSREQVEVSAYRAKLSAMLDEIGESPVLTASLHDDFQYSNIMILGDGRACAIDADGSRRAPVYYDLATLLVDPQTRLVQFFSFGNFAPKRQLAHLREVVLSTYFEGKKVDELVLSFYCALVVLHKWRMDEKKLMTKGFLSVPFILVVRFRMKQILQEYLA